MGDQFPLLAQLDDYINDDHPSKEKKRKLFMLFIVLFTIAISMLGLAGYWHFCLNSNTRLIGFLVVMSIPFLIISSNSLAAFLFN